MVRRLCDEKAAVSAEIADTAKVENLKTNDWNLAEGYVTILSPFEQASRELCGESYPKLSMKIPALHGLHQQLQNFVKDVGNRRSGITLAHNLVSSLERRFPYFARYASKYIKNILYF